jgi:chromatin segregation and condensation protein Rec8/ScpA/Scc1 (kleisin family)
MLPEEYDRIEAIVLFLAVLEMIKQQYANVHQEELFSDIQILATEKTFTDQKITLALDT